VDAGETALGAVAFVLTGGVGHTATEEQDTINGYEPQAAAGGAGKGNKPHGNTVGNQPAELYALIDSNGRFLKWGVSQNPNTRYSKSELNGGRVVVVGSGTRDEMIALERALTESMPGPANNEPWAGSAK
jgi:hypothetical protein